MLTELKQGSKVVGVKQTKRAVRRKTDSGGAGSPDEGTGLRMRYRRA